MNKHIIIEGADLTAKQEKDAAGGFCTITIQDGASNDDLMAIIRFLADEAVTAVWLPGCTIAVRLPVSDARIRRLAAEVNAKIEDGADVSTAGEVTLPARLPEYVLSGLTWKVKHVLTDEDLVAIWQAYSSFSERTLRKGTWCEIRTPLRSAETGRLLRITARPYPVGGAEGHFDVTFCIDEVPDYKVGV